jgi:hypothetical protein
MNSTGFCVRRLGKSQQPVRSQNTDVGISGRKGYSGLMNISTDDFPQFMTDIMDVSKYAKQALCADVGGPADGVPILVWVSLNEDGEAAPAIVACPTPTEELPARDVLYAALNEAFVELGTPVFGAFVSEAYIKREVTEGERDTIKRGDMERDFKNNAETNVVECITIIGFSRTGHREYHIVEYKYDDSGQPNFSEVVRDGMSSGALVDVLDNFMGIITA